MNIQVEGKTLKSLRNRYRETVEIAAKKLRIDPAILDQWENHGVELSLTDAKKIAAAYHSHWSILLLKSKVKEIEQPANHRAGYSDSSNFSSDTLRAYEIAHKLLDSSEEIDGRCIDERLTLNTDYTNNTSPVDSAQVIRKVMDITEDDVMAVKGGSQAVYKFWRANVSRLGIYISDQAMPEKETKAFLMKEGMRAVIVINKNDRYVYSKVFSLLHELGHLVKGEDSAACIVTAYAERIAPVETWCNKFASELAASDALVMSDKRVDTIKNSDNPAKIIRNMAIKYKVSFTVMLYKLKKHNKVTDQQANDMKAFFENVILPRYYPKPREDVRLGRAYYINKDVSKASVGLTKEVMEKQAAGIISYSQAAELLDTRAKYLEDIKQVVGLGS